MAVQTSSDINTRPFILDTLPIALRRDAETIKQDAGRAAVLASKTLMGKLNFTEAIAVAEGGTNTGDGTVTAAAIIAGNSPQLGAYNLECTAAGSEGRAAGTITPDGGNTGGGAITALAISAGDTPKIGSYVVNCIDENFNGTATGTAEYVGTGNGTASAVVTGADTLEGLYTLTCVDATVSGSEVFEVADPNGVTLETLTVGVAYLNAHLGITISDGSTDFTVGGVWTITMVVAHGGKFNLVDPDGEVLTSDIALPGTPDGTIAVDVGGITFTLADATPDFADDDFFTLTIVIAEGGLFKLEDPNGNLLANNIEMSGVALGASVFMSPAIGMTFTITDGAADFIVGDTFALTVSGDGDWTPYDPASILGAQFPTGIYDPEGNLGDITAAALVAADVTDMPILIGGVRFDSDQLVFENGAYTSMVANTGMTVTQYLEMLNMYAEETVAGSAAENV